MNCRVWLAAGFLAWPAAAAEPPPPDPEFLEFLAETADEDPQFAEYMESRRFERELRKVEEERAAGKDENHEP
jgi:hypothetical protein